MKLDPLSLWLAFWRGAAPGARTPLGNLRVRPMASDAPMRALLASRPDWKTGAIASILAERSGDFLDVGANVGQTLLDFVSAPVHAAYVGFEPNPVCCEHLLTLISANRLGNCRIIPAALGDRNGVATLYSSSDVDAGATLLRELRPAENVHSSSVCVYCLDDLADVISAPGIALLKIDVEGAELEALRGMKETISRHQPWIICEVLHRDRFADPKQYAQRCSELTRLIDEIGYSAFRIVQDNAGAKIEALRKVSSFPNVAWHEHSATACDYLFVPSAEARTARNVLIPAGQTRTPRRVSVQ